MDDTAIVKAGVISELVGKEIRYIVWAQTWDGTLYFEVGDATLTTHERCIDRASEALGIGEHVNNGAWCKGSLG